MSELQSRPSAELTQDERLWAVIAHASSFSGFLIPFGNILGPLVVWVVKKDESEFVAKHALEALNFKITVMIASFACALLAFACIGFPLLIALLVGDLIITIMAIIAANDGEHYEYPMTLRLIS